MRLTIAGLMALLLSAPASADITLSGYQHIGDGSSSTYTPADPVKRAQMQSNPTHFYLSQAATVTAVQLTAPNGLGNQLQVFIDNMTTALSGTLSGSCDTDASGTCTYTLTTPIALSAGSHTIWPDGGCVSGSAFATSCPSGNENDFGFSSIVLVSSATSLNRSLNRRYHLGDFTENGTSNEYYSGTYYPDAPDGITTVDVVNNSMSFTVDANRLLSEVRFWRARDVNANNLVLLDGVQIGTLSSSGSPATISTNVAVATGTHTLTVSSVISGSSYDDFSWDDIVLILVNNPATTPGLFNAVDTGADAGSGQIQTKVAGASVTLDLAAVTAGLQLATYTGTVTVSLLDASTTTGVLDGVTNCDVGWFAVTTSSSTSPVTFAAADAGRKAWTFTYAGTLTEARVRITDSALGVTGCSTDSFAIRPSSFATPIVTHNDRQTPGTAQSLATGAITETSTPVHQAGQYFTISATALDNASATATTYAGSPILVATGSALGGTTGDLSATGWSVTAGVATTQQAKYDEVGAVTMLVRDTTFAAIDVDDTADADRYIESPAITIGRFVPDHLAWAQTTPAQFAAACASGGMTYVGQPFSFVATPTASITAVNKGGDTTVNYTGTLAKLSVAAQAVTWAASTGGVGTFDTSGMPNPDNTFAADPVLPAVWNLSLVPRTGGYQFTRGAPSVPFQADISATVAITESDGVGFTTGSGTVPGSFGVATTGNGIPFTGSATTNNNFRFGRLAMDNAHGSEKLPLTIPLRAEYWVGTNAGFARNLLDSCTTIAAGVISVTPNGGGATSLQPEPNTLSAGLAQPALDAPTPAVTEQVDLVAQITASLPWLLTDDNDADTTYDDEPKAVAYFGLYKNDERRIFQQEVISP